MERDSCATVHESTKIPDRQISSRNTCSCTASAGVPCEHSRVHWNEKKLLKIQLNRIPFSTYIKTFLIMYPLLHMSQKYLYSPVCFGMWLMSPPGVRKMRSHFVHGFNGLWCRCSWFSSFFRSLIALPQMEHFSSRCTVAWCFSSWADVMNRSSQNRQVNWRASGWRVLWFCIWDM